MNSRELILRIWVMVALVLTALPVWAGGVSEVRKQAEASMLLTGSVEVRPDGSLIRYQLDQPEKIDPTVREFVESNIKSWSFAVSSLPKGVSANATVVNTMSILVVAKQIEGDKYEFRLASSYFSPKKQEPGTEFEYKDRKKMPVYPNKAVHAHLEGSVYLLVKVNPDGSVGDAIAEQVNLRGVANSEKEMESWRTLLATSALTAVKRWTFVVPTVGEQAQQPFFLVRVPVTYAFPDTKQAEYGGWDLYVPGPRHTNDWEQADDNPGFAPDALAANGGIYSSNGLRLNSPLQRTTNGG